MPARLAIFVAQLGRKFRLISLIMQMYESFIAVDTLSGRHSLLRAAVLQFSKGLPHTLHLLLYIYIYLYI